MDTLGLLLRVAASLAAVLGLVWMVRRGLLRSGGGRARAAVGSITVLARQQLTSRASVALVQVGGTGLVLGVTDSSVQVLASRPVDELLLQPAEPAPAPRPPAPRPLVSRPAGRRLLPTARRESVALPAVLLPAALPAPEELSPDASLLDPAPAPAPVAAPVPVLSTDAAAEAVPGRVVDPASSPTPDQGLAPGQGVTPDQGLAPSPGLEPLYEELRRRALESLPRQERRDEALSAPEPSTPGPAAGFEALLGLEVDGQTATGTTGGAAGETGGGDDDPVPASTQDAPAATPVARHARHARRGAPPRGGALSGSALSPATWAQAVDALRERSGRR